MRADGAYRISADQEIVLALRGGDWREPTVEVVEEQTRQSHAWELEVGATQFIALGTVGPGAYTAHVRDWRVICWIACGSARSYTGMISLPL